MSFPFIPVLIRHVLQMSSLPREKRQVFWPGSLIRKGQRPQGTSKQISHPTTVRPFWGWKNHTQTVVSRYTVLLQILMHRELLRGAPATVDRLLTGCDGPACNGPLKCSGPPRSLYHQRALSELRRDMPSSGQLGHASQRARWSVWYLCHWTLGLFETQGKSKRLAWVIRMNIQD